MARLRPRGKKADHRRIDQLRALIGAGIPWEWGNNHEAGRCDLLGLVTGHFYFPVYCDRDDEESQRALWNELKDDILSEHIKRKPFTRPWAWWKFDAPELRRVVGHDVDEDDDKSNSHDDGRLPAFQDPNLPEWAKRTYFGEPSVYDGYVYETERDYLMRLKLLTTSEKISLR